MKISRVMIAAPKSGSGKTTVTCALLKALTDRNRHAVSFKCGPDYIDPMFHRHVIGIPSGNLDTFFTDKKEILKIFTDESKDADIAVIEGVMGIFDGLGGVRQEGSSYHLAMLTNTPIVLAVDAKGMGRSVIPLIAGFLKYDTANLIKGVILNRMTEAFFRILKPLIEEELHIKALGCFPDNRQLNLSSRHLGLVLPDELGDIRKLLKAASYELEKHVCLSDLINIADAAEDLPDQAADTFDLKGLNDISEDFPVNIAVARDEAFCFYYRENLKMLEDFGAELTFFSPIHDSSIPDGADAVILGGGYPELYLPQLSANANMLRSVRAAFDSHKLIIAECGGFMYLHSAITDTDGNRYEMAGVLDGECSYTGRSVRFGYIDISENDRDSGRFLPEGVRIKGHEFHYYDSTFPGDSCTAVKPVTGREYPCIISGDHYWMGFPHLYYPSSQEFVKAIINKARQ